VVDWWRSLIIIDADLEESVFIYVRGVENGEDLRNFNVV
jgi:hypothetical protein